MSAFLHGLMAGADTSHWLNMFVAMNSETSHWLNMFVAMVNSVFG